MKNRYRYELEIDGKVVAKRFRYDLLRKKAAIQDRPFQIFTYRQSKMNKSLRITVEDDEVLEATKLRAQGMPWEEVASYLGWNKKTLQIKVWHKYGSSREYNRLTDPQKNQIIMMYSNGVKITAISKEIGASYQVIWKFIQNYLDTTK